MIIPGCAVAALGREALGERPLHRVELAIARKPLDRLDAVAGRLHGEDQAGVDHRFVQVDGAGGALALVARALGAHQAEVVAQGVDQRAVRLDEQVVGDAVDVELDG